MCTTVLVLVTQHHGKSSDFFFCADACPQHEQTDAVSHALLLASSLHMHTSAPQLSLKWHVKMSYERVLST